MSEKNPFSRPSNHGAAWSFATQFRPRRNGRRGLSGAGGGAPGAGMNSFVR